MYDETVLIFTGKEIPCLFQNSKSIQFNYFCPAKIVNTRSLEKIYSFKKHFNEETIGNRSLRDSFFVVYLFFFPFFFSSFLNFSFLDVRYKKEKTLSDEVDPSHISLQDDEERDFCKVVLDFFQ